MSGKKGKQNSDKWIIDSGVTHHITCDLKMFYGREKVSVADGINARLQENRASLY